jgi:hypothetical protein
MGQPISIPSLPQANLPLVGTELIVVEQGGVTSQTTIDDATQTLADATQAAQADATQALTDAATAQATAEQRVVSVTAAPLTPNAVDNTDPLNPIVLASIITLTGSGVDNTDPYNPVVNGVVEEIFGLDVDSTDPAHPIINVAVDGITITGSGTLADPLVANVGVSYKTYKGFLTISGGGTVVSFDSITNEIGNIVWTIQTTGLLFGTLTDAFPSTKYFGIVGGMLASPYFFSIERQLDSRVRVFIRDVTGTAVTPDGTFPILLQINN